MERRRDQVTEFLQSSYPGGTFVFQYRQASLIQRKDLEPIYQFGLPACESHNVHLGIVIRGRHSLFFVAYPMTANCL